MAGSSTKRLTGIILFILAAVGVATFLFLLFADSEGYDAPGTGDIPTLGVIAAIILGVIALVLAILLLVRSYDKRASQAADAEAFFIPEDDEWIDDDEEVVSFDDLDSTPEVPAVLHRERVVPYDLSAVPLGSTAWGHMTTQGQQRIHAFHYPREHHQALYNNDYIVINGNGDQLKLRTLLAAPEGVFDGLRDDPVKGSKVKAPVTSTVPARAVPRAPEARPAPARAPAKAPAKVAPKPYYDYAGDVDDVVDIEGIGPVYAKKLGILGVKTTARLCYEDAASLARAIDAPAKTVRTWQIMAEFMKVRGIGGQYAEVLARAGVDGIDDLKKRKADDIADAINAYLDGVKTNVIGNKITAKRVEGWKAKAAPMRRVRLPVPEE